MVEGEELHMQLLLNAGGSFGLDTDRKLGKPVTVLDSSVCGGGGHNLTVGEI